ncbi:MAG: hypothetical protein QG567_1569, partial [Campylobacterota bacterium]|nr:hypothetical protein [Campylobacterota bacterium]
AADGILLEANSLYINISSLSGESTPSKRTLEAGGAKRELDAKNMIYAGATVTSGSGLAVVTTTAQATEFGKIAVLTKTIQRSLTPMQKEIIHITRVMTIIAVLVSVVFFVLGLFSDKGALVASVFALSLIVATVPEGLLPTITLSLSLASQRMAKRNALIKNLDSVQTLGSATVICTDKTGTLTKNEMTLKKIFLTGGEVVEISGEGYFESGEIIFDKNDKNLKKRVEEFLSAGYLNSRAKIEKNKVFGDPTELAIVAGFLKANINLDGFNKIDEIPFTSDRKMMSSIYEKNGKKTLFSKGACEVIIEKSSFYIDDDGVKKELDDNKKIELIKKTEEFEKEAFRVLAIAIGEEKEENLTLLGFTAIMDLPRAEVKEAIEICKQAGIRTMMITGDNPVTASAIAKKIGMSYDEIITGDELNKISDEELEEILKTKDILFARMASSQKLKIAVALQNNGEVVAMTGDGVNDAPALKKADIGIAMGLSGTEVAKEAADMILLDDNFKSIVSAVEEGRSVYFNIKKFVTYILASNVPEIIPYILQFFLKIPLPLSVIQILSIDLGTDMFPGLALGSEKPEKNIMKRAPVGKNEKILDKEVFKRGYFFIGLIEAVAAMVAFIGFLLLNGWEYGQVDLGNDLLQRQAMTMTLLGAISCQILNVWTLRSWEFSAFSLGLFSNKMLLFAMFMEVSWVLMFLYVEPVQNIFNTAPVPLEYLWLLLPFPIVLFTSHELYKWQKRRVK